MTPAAETARLDRLTRQIKAAAAPIIWLRGMAGSGKSTLLRALIAQEAEPGGRRVIDLDAGRDDAPEAALTLIRERLGAGEGLLIASRPSSALTQVLLRDAAYGRTLTLGDAELFFSPAELEGALGPDGLTVHAQTGGWPLLVGAALGGRGAAMRALLPDFLNTEGLPSLSHPVVVALFAAAEAPFPASAAVELFGAIEGLHPLLRAGASGVELASAWCAEAIRALQTKPNLWRRATTDSLVRVYARHGEPVRAIQALNGLGQSRMACEVYDDAGGPYLALRREAADWKGLIDSFPAGLDQRRESLVLGRVWEALSAGRPAIAQARLEAHFPGLPVDLRAMRYSHRPHAILFRLMIEAEVWSGPPRDVVESWLLLDALLEPEALAARGMLMRAFAHALAWAGDPAGAARRLRAWREGRRQTAWPGLDRRLALSQAHLDLWRGELDQARRGVDEAGPAGPVASAVGALIAFERGQAPAVDDAPHAASWPGLSWDLMRMRVVDRLWREGLAASLDHLTDQASLVRRRHGGVDERAVQGLKIRLHQMARRHAEAAALIAGLGSPLGEGGFVLEETLLRLRAALVERRLDAAAAGQALEAAEQGEPPARARITLAVLRAYLHHRLGEAADCRRHAAAAVRLASAQGQLAPLIEDAELFEGPLAQMLAQRAAFPESLVIAAETIRQRLRRTPSTASHARDAAGLSRQEHRVLDQLSDGKSNKEIARSLGITDSTVKFHLRSLFARFDVGGRKALIDAARRRGVIK